MLKGVKQSYIYSFIILGYKLAPLAGRPKGGYIALSYTLSYRILYIYTYREISTLSVYHHIISYYIILYHIISYYIILYHIISYYIILYHIISYYIILYHILSFLSNIKFILDRILHS